MHEPHRVFEAERAGCDERAVLAERMTRRAGGQRQLGQCFTNGRQRGDARRHDRGLRVLGERELCFRPFEAQVLEREAERRVGALPHFTCGGRPRVELLAHADLLRTLPGE
jgi:hypothetical protein